ncbi:MAG: GntR family transcriptional regulator [Bacteroidota bacterium]|nr:GntR family transcriptional regulator [Bacteroidota bacterium]
MIFDAQSSLPKYKQIVSKIEEDIENGLLKIGDSLLSINEFADEHEIARDTVEKAYKELKNRGLLTSVKGKGYYINSKDTTSKIRIFLHFNKLSAYKKTIYNAFINQIGESGSCDIFIHHNDIQLFATQLQSALGNYTHYVVIPPDLEDKDQIIKSLKKVPAQKLILLDKMIIGFEPLSAVYQDFEHDIQTVLFKAIIQIKKYRKLSLVFPKGRGYAKEVMAGFALFCQNNAFEFDIISAIEENKVNQGKVFVVIEEDDLVKLLKICKIKQLKPGTDIGIISYNETPLKEILADGITVISTDFEAMGSIAAKLIINNERKVIRNDFRMIERNSL